MLDRVDDSSGSTGFSENVQQGDEYGYDMNGNLNRDDNKGYNYIDYNYLNLPWHVGTSGQYITYIYDAGGTKLAKIGTAGNYTYYAGSFIYSGSSLSYILNQEGMWLPGGSYQYYLKDHLGNTRLAVNTSGQGGTVVQQTDYYPYGMDIAVYNGGLDNKYRYNGKEFQEDAISGKNLNWYDYGARFYDPVLGRFHTLDSRAEDYYCQSPYTYAANNPIIFIDKDGKGPLLAIVGAAAGAVVGGGIEAVSQLYKNGSVTDWGAVGGSALQGGITGGVAGLTNGASLLVTATAAGTANAVGGALNRTLQGQETNVTNVVVDATIGAGLAAGGKISKRSCRRFVKCSQRKIRRSSDRSKICS